jgi:hypothetical protein
LRTKDKADLAADATPHPIRIACPASSYGVGQADGELLSAPAVRARRAPSAWRAAALGALLGACAGDPTREADRPFTAGFAKVSRVDLALVSTRPPRLRIEVSGSLPDVCTEIDRIDTRRLGSRIEITLETRRPFGAGCPPAETPFNRSIPLMLPEEFRHYVVDVNGVSGTVLLPPASAPDPLDGRRSE